MDTTFCKCFAVIITLVLTYSYGKSHPGVSPYLEPSIEPIKDTKCSADRQISALVHSVFNGMTYDKVLIVLPVLLGYFKALIYLSQKCSAATSCSVDLTSTSLNATTTKTTLSIELILTKLSVISSTFSTATTSTTTKMPTRTLTLSAIVSQSITQTLAFTSSIFNTRSFFSTTTGYYTSVLPVKSTRTTVFGATVTETSFVFAGKRRKDLSWPNDDESYMTVPVTQWPRSWQKELAFAGDEDDTWNEGNENVSENMNSVVFDNPGADPNIASSKDAEFMEPV